MLNYSRLLVVTTYSIIFLLASACSEQSSKKAATAPWVQKTLLSTLESKTSVSPESNISNSLQGTLVFEKRLLLDGKFFYTADLQYSSIHDEGMDLYLQSLVLTQQPAYFKIQGEELLLLAEQNRLNLKPDYVISRYKIVDQTADTLSVNPGNAAVALTFFISGAATGSTPTVVDHWTRSVEWIPEGSYLLQESSLQLADGSVAEIMESVFPRGNQTPGPDFLKIKLDADTALGYTPGTWPDSVSYNENLFQRFRFLTGDVLETLTPAPLRTTFAEHFDISNSKTIDWYVTRNAPEENLSLLKAAVEGWNRYYLNMKGIERHVVRFLGYLPENVRVGDPRFNVIQWDNRLIAGAAYESQAADPETGLQSHSLIYLPAAWLNIGYTYWKYGKYSENSDQMPRTALRSHLHQKNSPASTLCKKDLKGVAAFLASGAFSPEEASTFSKQLLKSTLMHEVGHALGMAHNFKGSLSYNRDKENSGEKTPYTNSIMDYNVYEFERDLFETLDSEKGPSLEYDRQFISALYNQSRDILVSDPTLPVCTDFEVELKEGGVDPLCNQYDMEMDPTLAIQTAQNRIQNGEIVAAFNRAVYAISKQESVEKIDSLEALNEWVQLLNQSLLGSLNFYFVSGKTSLNRAIRSNLKSLLDFSPEISLDTPYSEYEMRERVWHGVQYGATLYTVPSAIKAGLNQALTDAQELLLNSPYIRNLNEADQLATLSAALSPLYSIVSNFESAPAQGLPLLRTLVLKSLARQPQVAYFFGDLKTKAGSTYSYDFERDIIALLSQIAGDSIFRSADERMAATTSLQTFATRYWGEWEIKTLKTKLDQERASAKNRLARELAESLLQIINTQ